MVIRTERELQIEDLRSHPKESVATLRDILAGGGKITPDPKRPGFYEVEDASTVYWIHVVPTSGRVMLLATWPVNAATHTDDSPEITATEECCC